jgi:murein DD-endopeptidase MepM/ murein hydrolase activator NlpD
VVGRLERSCARLAAGVIFVVSAAGLMAGCFNPSSAPPASPAVAAGFPRHTVEPGETIYHLARLYRVSPASLMAVNGLSDPRQLAVGQMLVIPTNRKTTGSVGFSPWLVPRADRQFAWPVAGPVSSLFGIRNGVMHNGVDIVARIGTPVHAADDGTVIFAGRLHGYGNAIILQHSGGYATVYGHNERNLVRYGAQVVRGQVIADLGSSGRATGPNLHFEVRFQGQPKNPLAYLPPVPPSNSISFARNGGS